MSPESFSVQRRALDVEDYLDILRRHKAWILGPTFAGLVLSVVVAFLWPDTFISTAVIRVVPQQVPESLVPSNINIQMSQRINSMAQTILSRSNLSNLITTFDLYKSDRQRKPMEDVIEGMRKDISIGQVVTMTGQSQESRGISAFRLSFSYDNRIMAQKVTSDLVSRFMSENTRARTTESVLTTQFLRDQVENAKKDLDGIEERLKNFNIQYQGRLPGQGAANQMQLNSLEQRIASINGSLSRLQQDKLVYESELRSLKNQLASLTPPADVVMAQQKNEAVLAKEREIAQMEQQLGALREHYRDTYPDVRRLISLLNAARKTRDNLVREDEAKRAESPATAPKRYDPQFERESRALQASIERVVSQIRTREMQTDDYQREIAGVEKQIKVVQGRIEQAPVSEAEFSHVIRDRETAKLRYDELNRKLAQSRTAEDVEKRQQGETLEMLDSASLPETPVEPKRPVLIGIGTGVGFLIGLMFAGAREAKDTSLKNLKDVRAYTQLTVLGSVPLLENDLVVRRRRRLAWLAWSTACLVGIVIMTGSVLYYYTTKI